LLLQSDGLPALVTLKKGLVALARQWMKFIVVTPAFKGVSLHRPAQPLKPPATVDQEHEEGLGLDNGGGLQSDTSADGAEFEFDAGNFCSGSFSFLSVNTLCSCRNVFTSIICLFKRYQPRPFACNYYKISNRKIF
jgi:hypothetical protein